MVEESANSPGEFDEKTLKRAEYCANECKVCVKGRDEGSGFSYSMVKLFRPICPYCKAYEKVYGVPAYEKPASES